MRIDITRWRSASKAKYKPAAQRRRYWMTAKDLRAEARRFGWSSKDLRDKVRRLGCAELGGYRRPAKSEVEAWLAGCEPNEDGERSSQISTREYVRAFETLNHLKPTC